MNAINKNIDVIAMPSETGKSVDHNQTEHPYRIDSDILMDFVSIMIHDLQAPLTSMKTLVKFLNEGKYNPGKKAHYDLVKSTVIALERSESIIYDLFDAARAEKVGIPYKLEDNSINEIIENSVEMIQPSAIEHGITIQKKLLKSDLRVNSDRNLLLRVLDNLLFNACQHSPHNSKVLVEAECSENKVIITISDEGSGFADIDPEILFDKYKQVSLRKIGKFKGAGMGLYFCRLVINTMGGRIWVENNPDGGASFKIALNIG